MSTDPLNQKRAPTLTTDVACPEATMPQLPTEIMLNILGYLDKETALKARQANSEFRACVRTNAVSNFKQSFRKLLEQVSPHLTAEQNALLNERISDFRDSTQISPSLPPVPFDTKEARAVLRRELIQYLAESPTALDRNNANSLINLNPPLALPDEFEHILQLGATLQNIQAIQNTPNGEPLQQRICDMFSRTIPETLSACYMRDAVKLLSPTAVSMLITFGLSPTEDSLIMELIPHLPVKEQLTTLIFLKKWDEALIVLELIENPKAKSELFAYLIRELANPYNQDDTKTHERLELILECLEQKSDILLPQERPSVRSHLTCCSKKELKPLIDKALLIADKAIIAKNFDLAMDMAMLLPASMGLYDGVIEEYKKSRGDAGDYSTILEFGNHHGYGVHTAQTLSKLISSTVLENIGRFDGSVIKSFNFCFPNLVYEENHFAYKAVIDLLLNKLKFEDLHEMFSSLPTTSSEDFIKHIWIIFMSKNVPCELRQGALSSFSRNWSPDDDEVDRLVPAEYPELASKAKEFVAVKRSLWNVMELGEELKNYGNSLMKTFLTSGLESVKALLQDEELTPAQKRLGEIAVELFQLI